MLNKFTFPNEESPYWMSGRMCSYRNYKYLSSIFLYPIFVLVVIMSVFLSFDLSFCTSLCLYLSLSLYFDSFFFLLSLSSLFSLFILLYVSSFSSSVSLFIMSFSTAVSFSFYFYLVLLAFLMKSLLFILYWPVFFHWAQIRSLLCLQIII
jgi:hypothetical protein